MAFNFGTFAGGAVQGAETAAKDVQQYQANKTQQQNQAAYQQAMQNAPVAGAPNTNATPTGYTDANGNAVAMPGGIDPTADRQGNVTPQYPTYTQQDVNNYAQNAALQNGQVGATGDTLWRGGMANEAAAGTTGKNIANSQEVGAQQAAQQTTQMFNTNYALIQQGNVGAAAQNVVKAATQAGAQFQMSQDGKTAVIDGQQVDMTSPQGVMLAQGILSHHIMTGAITAQNPQLGTQMQRTDNESQQVNNQSALIPSEVALRGAQTNEANTTASVVDPALANAHNATANAENGRAGLEGAQTGAINISNSDLQNADTYRAQYAALPPQDQAGPMGQSLQQKILAYEPGAAGARAMSSVYGSNQRATTAANAQTAKGSAANKANWTESPNTPGLFTDKSTGAQFRRDPRTGQMQVLSTGFNPQSAPGVKTMGRTPGGSTIVQGKVGGKMVTGYHAADGKTYTSAAQADAANQQYIQSTTQAQTSAGTQPTGDQPPPLQNGAIPLPGTGYNEQAGLPTQ